MMIGKLVRQQSQKDIRTRDGRYHIVFEKNKHSSLGNYQNAVDGVVADNNQSTFHNNNPGSGWFELDFTASAFGLGIFRIEIEARGPTYTNRMGNTIDVYSTSGAHIETITIVPSGTSFGIDGSWSDVGRIRINDSDNYINLAEVRTFSTFVDGVAAVPEPASTSLLALGGVALLLRRRK